MQWGISNFARKLLSLSLKIRMIDELFVVCFPLDIGFMASMDVVCFFRYLLLSDLLSVALSEESGAYEFAACFPGKID